MKNTAKFLVDMQIKYVFYIIILTFSMIWYPRKKPFSLEHSVMLIFQLKYALWFVMYELFSSLITGFNFGSIIILIILNHIKYFEYA